MPTKKPTTKKPAAKQAAARKVAAKAEPTKPVKPQRAAKAADWDAIERDYRTGRFTFRELETKYGVPNSTIMRRQKREGWSADLSNAVRQATNAALIQAHVQQECSAAQQNAAETVLAAAEVNKQVILAHRKQLADLQAHAQRAREKLVQLGDAVADVKEAATLVSALEAAARTTKIVIEAERKAFGIDSPAGTEPSTPEVAPSGMEPGEAYLIMVQGAKR